MSTVGYAPEVQQPDGTYKVTYMINETKAKLTRGFFSPFEARKFINKLRYSKRCTLVSYPNSIYR